MTDTIIQYIGFIGLGICSSVGLWKTKKHMLLVSICGLIFFVIHYYLLGAYSGALIDLLAAIRSCVALSTTSMEIKIIFYLIPLVICVFNPVTLPNISVCFASILNTQSSFSPTPQEMRLFNVISGPFWFYYNYSIMSYSGMTGDITGIVVNIIGLIIYRRSSL